MQPFSTLCIRSLYVMAFGTCNIKWDLATYTDSYPPNLNLIFYKTKGEKKERKRKNKVSRINKYGALKTRWMSRCDVARDAALSPH